MEKYEPKQSLVDKANEIMDSEPELSYISSKREKMLSDLEKMGKTGFLTMDIELNPEDRNGDLPPFVYIRGNINGHAVEMSTENNSLFLDGKNISELFEEFYSKYGWIAYKLHDESDKLSDRKNRIDYEKNIKEAREILF